VINIIGNAHYRRCNARRLFNDRLGKHVSVSRADKQRQHEENPNRRHGVFDADVVLFHQVWGQYMSKEQGANSEVRAASRGYGLEGT